MPEHQTFRLKRRGTHAAQEMIFLVLKDAALEKTTRQSLPVNSPAPCLTGWNESPIGQRLTESNFGLVRK
jgi:hypothetical protein